ncbi:uncharacterized protein [Rutidosis leptorrhynchoides]|uniref:uncharacterized protein n=1 Tax=Rutidosis leptorrhynchoides TaxID=125765 RepID=UPI003A9929DD
MPVYFVSKVVQHGKVTYKPIEKLIFALVHTARRLIRYFQAHPMLVVTDSPIKQVLSKPEVYGRAARWAIELGEHEISYPPLRTTVKGQIMADFMVEFICTAPPEPAVEEVSNTVTWELFTDRASSADGAGAGLTLISPDGEEHTYTLHFEFPASNNEAEYEALLSSLRMAEKMGIKALKVSVDSQLVSNQMNGTFEARDLAMQKYLKLAEEMANKLELFSITQVPRSMNKKADVLSKLATSVFSHFAKDVWVEVLCQKSTNVVQANGQVEVTNRDIVAEIRARLDTDRKGWADELPQVLWAFRTTPQGSNREMPFSLVYGSEAVIPAEIAVPTQRVMEFNDESNVINLKENLDLLEERHDIAAIREAFNKQKIAKYYVWRNNNANRVEDTGKLGPN